MKQVIKLNTYKADLKKNFNELSTKGKKQRVKCITDNFSIQEVEFALEVLKNNRSTISKRESLISPIKALALIEDLNLSQKKYKIISDFSNRITNNMYPTTYNLTNLKKEILPDIFATESSASVSLSVLLKKTVLSILKMCKISDNVNNLKIVFKWGMDGSGGHSMYKQNFSNSTLSDEYIFLVACVPLE